MPDLGQYQITGSTAREIAASTEAAIREGLLESGDALPTVRALAEALGASPATVNSAYRTLRERGLVLAEGRRGTRVAPRPALRLPQPAHGRGYYRGPAPGFRDLSVGLPDAELVPPLAPVLARIDLERKLAAGGLERSDPELLELAAASFSTDGVRCDAITVVSGAFDGIERVLQAHLRPGDRVIIEDPAYIGIVDLLRALGLVAVPVPVDELGLLPGPFEASLARGAEAAVIVPRAQNPFGSALDEARAVALRQILEDHPGVLVVEDDHAGLVSGAPYETAIASTASRWALIRSVSKFLHPDLRLALMAGDEATVGRVEGRQALGPRWVSHILQAVVVELMRDPSFTHTTDRAREAYATRRAALIEALAEHGVEAHGRSGLNVWVPVREEAAMMRALSDAGWLAMAGERFRLLSGPGIRLTISTLQEHEAVELARVIGAVEHAARPRSLY
jgi:DNA-binding transcriptional MocR family regulator